MVACSLACTSAYSTADAAHLRRGQPVELHLHIEQDRAGQPVAYFEFRNRRSYALAVTRTFGLEDAFLRVQIETRGGEPVPYPRGAQSELPERPEFNCVLPEGVAAITVPLNRWYVVVGGELRKDPANPEAGVYSFELEPGFYRIRALYDTVGGTTGPCLTPVGPFETPWIEFEVPAP